jgi:hypothetical protein
MSSPKQTELITEAETAIAKAEAPESILSVIQAAVDKDVSVDTLERLMALHERHEDRMARQAFLEAMRRFNEEVPDIPRNKKAKVATRGGGSFGYEYADLDSIANTVRPLLYKHGLSFHWSSGTAEGMMSVTCTLVHTLGHQIESAFTCPTENVSAATPQQKHGGALTYAKRQALVAVLGLTMCDPDTDGAGPPSGEISEKQATELDALIKDTGADLGKFLAFMRVESLGDIAVTDFGLAKRTLEEKARRG